VATREVTVPTVPLNSDVAMPALGLGTWTMTDAEAARTIPLAARLGYRMIDTATYYRNERGVGEGIRRSHVPRAEFFIVTKLTGRDHGYDRAMRGFEESLARLGVDYLDLYMIHWPLPMRDRYVDTWRALVQLRADGRVRAIGVSNFTPEHVDRIVAETDVVPAVNQIQLNPRVTQPASRAHAARRGIVVQAWQPLCLGGSLLTEPVIRIIARCHGRTPAQVVLRWHIEHGLVPIPKSAHEERLASNIDVFDLRLTPEDHTLISELDGTEIAVDPTTTEVD